MSTWRTKYIADKLAKRTFKVYHEHLPHQMTEEQKQLWKENRIQRMFGIYRKTRKICSCYMCGNPRKHYGNSKRAKTKQEFLADIKLKDEY